MPRHDGVAQACLAIAGFGGLLTGVTVIYLTKGLTTIQRVILPLTLTLMTAIGIFLVANRLSSIAAGWIDFPAGRSHTRQALLTISRAYQTPWQRQQPVHPDHAQLV
jgi:hypothetical protein